MKKHLDVAAQLRKLKVVHRIKVKQLAQTRRNPSSESMHSSQKSAHRTDVSDPVSETSLQNDDDRDETNHSVDSNKGISSPSYFRQSPEYSPTPRRGRSPSPYAQHSHNTPRSYSPYLRTSPYYSPSSPLHNQQPSSPYRCHGSQASRAKVQSPQIETHVNSSNPHVSLPNDTTHKRKRSINMDDERDQQGGGLIKTVKRDSDEVALEECNKMLNEMTANVELDDTVYVAACAIFCESRVHREQWMMLSNKSAEIKRRWILMIAKRLGLV